ncbi:hypothetical protein R1flu_007918 [Riccia fluitans]|uniref:Uncharacterized protein n=1 Tax=Riccia fluitans TaxID=41844 RepID=A0ABD1Z076_9MARC
MNTLVQCCLAAVLLFIASARASPISDKIPLDEYMAKADSEYRWYDTGRRLTGALPWEKWEGIVLNMTSQSWLSSADVDCSLWTHDLVIVKPCNYVHKKTALLVVAGGSNNGIGPTPSDELLILAATVAVKTGSLAAVVYQVPNQPCTFTSEHPPRPRSDDELVAYTWSYFLDNPDKTEWPLKFAMTKAVVRAMDTVQAYAKDSMKVEVDNFVVTGASKRGWTTWSTAAVDDRVVGIIPVVMDLLNMGSTLHHFYKSLGGWPVAFKAYYEANITSRLDSPEFQRLTDIVDPYVYKDRLGLPKLMVTASNDEFFLLDDSIYFWDSLPGEKHCLILADTDHSLATGVLKFLTGVEAFFLSIVESYELSGVPQMIRMKRGVVKELSGTVASAGSRPKYWYNINRDGGIIEIGTTEKPVEVLLWYAYTYKGTKGRDFRWFTADNGKCPTLAVKDICVKPVYFESRVISPTDLSNDDGMINYYASLSTPKEGYGAFFVEMRFAGPKPLTPFIVTTPAVIVPNYFPYGDCYGSDCRGKLV